MSAIASRKRLSAYPNQFKKECRQVTHVVDSEVGSKKDLVFSESVQLIQGSLQLNYLKVLLHQPGYLLRRALYGAVGAVLSTTLVQCYHTSGKHCLPLVYL